VYFRRFLRAYFSQPLESVGRDKVAIGSDIESDRIIVGSDTKILSDSKIGSDRIRPYPIRYPKTYPSDIGRISDIRRKWALGENSMLSIVYFASQ